MWGDKGDNNKQQLTNTKILILVLYLFLPTHLESPVGQAFQRISSSRYQPFILTVCGLVRLRIRSLILEVIESPESGQVIGVFMNQNFTTELIFENSNPH